eukprot:15330962-Ditylum_brightwellii.AAC.1
MQKNKELTFLQNPHLTKALKFVTNNNRMDAHAHNRTDIARSIPKYIMQHCIEVGITLKLLNKYLIQQPQFIREYHCKANGHALAALPIHSTPDTDNAHSCSQPHD